MKPILLKNEIIKPHHDREPPMFPEFFDLEVSPDHTKGDCLVYPDSPLNWKQLRRAKNKYNYRERQKVRGRVFVIRREVRHGEPVIVVQRIF